MRTRQHRTTGKDIATTFRNLRRNHHRPGLVQTKVFGILQHKLGILIEQANTLLLEHIIHVPTPIHVIKELHVASFSLGLHKTAKPIRKDSLAKELHKNSIS